MPEHGSRLDSLIDELRALPEPAPAARQRLNAALVTRQSARAGGLLVLTKARAIAAAAALVLVTSAAWLAVLQFRPAVSPAAAPLAVQFVFVHAGAQRVALVGDFNDWDERATQLTRAAGGVWSVVLPLRPGRFAYSFVVDGRVWFADPAAPLETNDFGRPSSIVYVSASETAP